MCFPLRPIGSWPRPPIGLESKQMGLIEDFANLPVHYVLIIVALLKIGLIICLCGTDWCSSQNPEHNVRCPLTSSMEEKPSNMTR